MIRMYWLMVLLKQYIKYKNKKRFLSALLIILQLVILLVIKGISRRWVTKAGRKYLNFFLIPLLSLRNIKIPNYFSPNWYGSFHCFYIIYSTTFWNFFYFFFYCKSSFKFNYVAYMINLDDKKVKEHT